MTHSLSWPLIPALLLSGCVGAETPDQNPDPASAPPAVRAVETAEGPSLFAAGENQSGAAIAMLGYCNIPVDTVLLDILTSLPVPTDPATGEFIFPPPQGCQP